ncbi:hypothetical protein KXV85_004375, partial [Aspergillus fumigatus]
GRIAAGYDADFTIVDLKRSETITNKWVASKAGWTPYDGVRVTGWPVGTFVRGRRVMWQGELVTPAQGEPVQFLETLKPAIAYGFYRDRGLASPLPLAGEADAPRAMRSIVPCAAGEGSLLWGISASSLDDPIAETALSPALPRTRGRELTADAAT